MSKRTHLAYLILAQIICIGVGLWMQQELVLAAMRRVVGNDHALKQILPAMVSTLSTASGITFIWCSVLLGMIVYLIVTRVHEWLQASNERRDVEQLKRDDALIRTQQAIIFGLAKLTDSRDAETGGHSERIALYSGTLALVLRRQEAFRDIVTPEFVKSIEMSSPLHDIGKVGVEDAILRKPGKLTPEERVRMQKHSRIGEDCLLEIERWLGQSNFLQMAREIAASHHERWDGCGYHRGLSGEQIPLAARIVAIADTYDALSCRRVYKPALPHEECIEIIRNEAGGQFDPRLVAAFVESETLFKSIAQRFDASRFRAGTEPTVGLPSVESPNLQQASV